MHLEIHIALNYLATHLYNKLPRRRINLFTEILSQNLSHKYVGHWYPDQPTRGSGYRCLKSTDPLIRSACSDSNISYNDVLDSLPKDLSIWVDPGEVSYRVGETGVSLLLWKEGVQSQVQPPIQQATTLNEEALMATMLISGNIWDGYPTWSTAEAPQSNNTTLPLVNNGGAQPSLLQQLNELQPQAPMSVNPLPTLVAPAPSAVPTQNNTSTTNKKPPQTLMTTAAFAQTKFGSTKLKSNTTRRSNNNRMSPTEFSNYIKQKQREQQGLVQQQQLNGWYGYNSDPWQPQQTPNIYGNYQQGQSAQNGAQLSGHAGVVAN